MDAITNKDTRTFPMDDVVFNRLLLPDKYINSFSEDEFYAFKSKQDRVNTKRFTDQQTLKRLEKNCRNVGKTPRETESIARFFSNDMEQSVSATCKYLLKSGKYCSHKAAPGCEGYCRKHYPLYLKYNNKNPTLSSSESVGKTKHQQDLADFVTAGELWWKDTTTSEEDYSFDKFRSFVCTPEGKKVLKEHVIFSWLAVKGNNVYKMAIKD